LRLSPLITNEALGRDSAYSDGSGTLRVELKDTKGGFMLNGWIIWNALQKEGFGSAVSQAKSAASNHWAGPADKVMPNWYKRVPGYYIIISTTRHRYFTTI